MRVAGVEAFDIGCVGEGDYDHDRAVGVNGITAHYHDRTRSGLLAALCRIETGAEDITANGFWERGFWACHPVCLAQAAHG